MEEQVGAFWHRLVTRLADTGYPKEAVRLSEVDRTVGLMFRALGGDGGLQVTSTDQIENRARRTWLQRLAGSQRKVSLAWRDDSYLRLPPRSTGCPRARSIVNSISGSRPWRYRRNGRAKTGSSTISVVPERR